MAELPGTVVDADGRRMIAASRRPDGTWRKERRVRDGYVPQDEQPIYQARPSTQRPRVPQVPGWDGPDAGSSSMSKAAKKNAKRKEKRAEDTQQQAHDKADETPPPLPPGWELAPPGAPPAGSRQAVCQKLILKTQKKLKQCDTLVKRQEAGEKLTREEDEKIAKMNAWQDELRQLQQDLESMSVS